MKRETCCWRKTLCPCPATLLGIVSRMDLRHTHGSRVSIANVFAGPRATSQQQQQHHNEVVSPKLTEQCKEPSLAANGLVRHDRECPCWHVRCGYWWDSYDSPKNLAPVVAKTRGEDQRWWPAASKAIRHAFLRVQYRARCLDARPLLHTHGTGTGKPTVRSAHRGQCGGSKWNDRGISVLEASQSVICHGYR